MPVEVVEVQVGLLLALVELVAAALEELIILATLLLELQIQGVVAAALLVEGREDYRAQAAPALSSLSTT